LFSVLPQRVDKRKGTPRAASPKGFDPAFGTGTGHDVKDNIAIDLAELRP
jgi:hypothetical protein